MNGIKEFSHRSIEVNGGDVSFIDVGSGPTLFLMHGIGGNSRSWQEQFKGLTSEYRICLLYTSPSPRDRYGSRMPSSA